MSFMSSRTERVTGGPTIAIVDNDGSVRRSLQRVVNEAGYVAETFASAREFLEWLADGHAACLVLDVAMRDMNGFELQERLAVPVILMTSHDDPTTRGRIEQSGATAHIFKPFGADALLRAIRLALERRPTPPDSP